VDPFSYVSLITSIVAGLGITRLMAGFGRLLQSRHQVRFYWVHFVWLLNVLIYILLNWWVLYRWRVQPTWTFYLFIFVLIAPGLLFLETVVLFPDELPAGADMKAHYYSSHRLFFLLAGFIVLFDVLDTWLKGWAHFIAQGPQYFLVIGVLSSLCFVAAFTKNARYHAFFSIFFLVVLFVLIALNLSELT
jgi:hypothetical protein